MVVSDEEQQFGVRFANVCEARLASLDLQMDGTFPSSPNVQVAFGMTFAGAVMDSNCTFYVGYILPGQFWIRLATPNEDWICRSGGGRVVQDGLSSNMLAQVWFSLQA